MALVICPDCQNRISEMSAFCQHCGRPMQRKGLGSIKVGFPAFFIITGLILFFIGATGTVSPSH